jgi:hypothetical protein
MVDVLSNLMTYTLKNMIERIQDNPNESVQNFFQNGKDNPALYKDRDSVLVPIGYLKGEEARLEEVVKRGNATPEEIELLGRANGSRVVLEEALKGM